MPERRPRESQLRAAFAEVPALSCQRSQGMTPGQVETFNQTGADLQSQYGQPGCPPTLRYVPSMPFLSQADQTR
jgi:hypothetical protein